MSVIDEIAAERHRQIEIEGWSAEHDDAHTDGSLATAAAVYALHPFRCHFVVEQRGRSRGLSLADFWPWEIKWLKPKTRRENLIKAGALIVAEIERLDRSPSPGRGGDAT